jgi:gamma-glutamylputrescine oxidase
MALSDNKSLGSSWYESQAEARPVRRPLTIELDVDVCIIGAGLAGLTAAREVARRGWSVAVLEADKIGSAASGRNTGFVLPGFAADPEKIVARVGLDQAKRLWALSEAGAEYVRRTVRETNMPGVDLAEGGWLHVAKTENERGAAMTAEFLAGELGAAVEHWPRERVRAALNSPLYFSGIHYTRGFTINPLNYALGLAAAAEAAGARIFEETPAVEIDPAGVRKRIVTSSGRVRASHIVLAGNVNIGRLMPRIAQTLVPISTYVITTAPLGERLRQVISYGGAVSDTELANNHYRVVGGDRLMWSGRSTVWARDPSRYVSALAADIARTYPQLGPVQVEYAWAGTLGNTVHRMPQIGEISPGVWIASGFGGHGLNTTAMAGELVARGIVDDDPAAQAFMSFDLVWAGGLLGRATAQVYSWSYSKHEDFGVWLTQRREKKHATIGDVVPAPLEPEAAAGSLESVVGADAEPVNPEPTPAIVTSAEVEQPAEATPPRRERKKRAPAKRRKKPAAEALVEDAAVAGGEGPLEAKPPTDSA